MDLFPDYKGELGAAAWSGFLLTPEVEKNLKLAALRNCPVCEGYGYLEGRDSRGSDASSKTVQICSCVHRREEWKPYGR